MNTSNQQYYGANAYQNRSDLLSGLRTEGLGLGSVFPPQGASQQSNGRNGATSPYMQTANLRQHQPQQQYQQQQQQHNSYRTQESLRDISALQASLEDQLAAMRLQSSLSLGQSDAQSGYQNYSNGYGQQQQYAQHHNNQQQQQYMQMQLQQQLAQQQAAAQQQRLELLRLQALQKQQQQYGQQQHQFGQQQYNQQQLAAQQRFLLSQLQGGNSDYEGASSHHANLMNQAQAAAASAQEQRQAAQASIQASLRQRQVQQLYQTMGLENDVPVTSYNEPSQQSLQQQQQQLQLQNILNRHTRKVSSDGPSPARTPLEQRSWRGGAVPSEERLPTPPGHRGASPASSIHSRKGIRPSSGTADSIMSMRSRTMTPSIVIDDSASEGSRAQSDGDQVEGDQTPETSEEDLEANTPIAKGLSSTPTPQQMNMQKQGPNGRYGSLGRGVASAPTSTSTTPPITAPKAIPRAIHLSAAPQHRAFKTNASSDGNQTINNAGLTLPPIQPRRQPKGQPTEFHKVNFQARMNSRLRKDAMSKLCASPRAASFGGNGISFGARLSSAGSSFGLPVAP